MNRVNLALHALNRFGRWAQFRLGTAGIAGVALLLAAAIGFALAALAHRETEWLSSRTEQARARFAQIRATHNEDHTPAEQLARFQQWFPLADHSTADLRVIFTAAQAAHVDLSRGEYSVRKVEGSGGLTRFEVILPVKEHYAPVKAFVADVLNKLPHASLDELRVERPGSAADQLESRVHFTLFYRERTG
ncbi:MAG TPA: hypothetical protein VH183_06690 [Burkholderiaceae bacterium]|nr:hypothetical protein [Burkholderiaceae bacterium]